MVTFINTKDALAYIVAKLAVMRTKKANGLYTGCPRCGYIGTHFEDCPLGRIVAKYEAKLRDLPWEIPYNDKEKDKGGRRDE